MAEVSLFRLYTLRAGYLLLAIGLGTFVWPEIVHHGHWEVMLGVERCLLGAIGLLAVLGLRYPVKMIPLLLFEMTWKAIWILAVYLPLWRTHMLDPDTAGIAGSILMVVIFPFLVPWRYVWRSYVLKPGDCWR